MVTSVTLGTFFTLSNGKTVLGGSGGSGLDTQGLVKSLTEAKSVGATENKKLITVNENKTTALAEFQSLLSAFKSSSDALRNPPGVGNDADNVFKFTTTSVAAAATPYVSASSAAGAALQSYDISAITSIATAARQSSGTFNVASADANVVPSAGGASFAIGTITFGTQDISITSGDSLNSIAAKFNAVSSITGVSASVIAIDSTHYKLSFVATQTGTASNFDLSLATDPSGVLTSVGLAAPTSGANAIFKLNGVDITRQSNTVSDVISNVTFTLLQTTPDSVTPYTVTIQPDTSIAQTVINDFVSNYNALKEFEAEQTQLKSDGTYSEKAFLANNQTFLSIMNNINSQVNATVSGITGNNPNSLVDIGITFTKQPATDTKPEVSNILTVNDGTLTSALTSNYTSVNKLFGFSLTSDNANLAIFKHNNSLSVSDLTLTLAPVALSKNLFTNTFSSTLTAGQTVATSGTPDATTPFKTGDTLSVVTATGVVNISTALGVGDTTLQHIVNNINAHAVSGSTGITAALSSDGKNISVKSSTKIISFNGGTNFFSKATDSAGAISNSGLNNDATQIKLFNSTLATAINAGGNGAYVLGAGASGPLIPFVDSVAQTLSINGGATIDLGTPGVGETVDQFIARVNTSATAQAAGVHAILDTSTPGETNISLVVNSNIDQPITSLNIAQAGNDETNFTTTTTVTSNNVQTADIDNPVFKATYDAGAGPVTVSLTAIPLGGSIPGYTLKGPSGTPIEGLELIYASESTATIRATLIQGIADKLFSTTDGALTQNTGFLALEFKSIKDNTERLNTDIENITKQVNVFQDQLLAKFTALEAAISRVNSLLSSLNANDNQRFAASQ